ncbi:replication protein A, subunit RPA32 [Macrolepiota fuliginosa MF-IS2]|uniref:Replication protein A, subunit RPA32 n=1 Tax=Macrolepiota fuliginosa MF-IS2 TaxID=1400762 RepID=A0A9P6CAX3_9AGAR|nr:replication protein A, subunit RPA32 [Macrolepiota fuliginosa MF-IS2]
MSQYDSYYGSGGGGGGGGGFLQGGSPFSQTGSPGGTQRSEASMSMRPITTNQFQKTEQPHGDAPWSLEGIEIGHVTVVGQVISMQQHTTNHIYNIEDGFGRVEARHWVGTTGNTEAEIEKWSGIEEGIYVRVSGFLKSFGNKKYINASYMRPVTDFNEVDFHFLECATVTMMLERGTPHSARAGGQKTVGAGSSAYQVNNAMDTQDEYSSLAPLQQQIIRFLVSQDNKDGVHVGVIARALGKADLDAEKLSSALDALLDSGHLFNTIDENHFALSR